jgi:hypothetical protein
LLVKFLFFFKSSAAFSLLTTAGVELVLGVHQIVPVAPDVATQWYTALANLVRL